MAKGLSWFERKYIQFGWGRMMKAMPGLKRWVPLIGSSLLVLTVVLRTAGLTDFATMLEGLTGVVGLDKQSPVSGAEATAAVAALAGLVLKFVSMHRAATASAYLEARPEAAKEAAVKEVLAPPPVSLDPAAVPAAPADVQAVKDVLRAKE